MRIIYAIVIVLAMATQVFAAGSSVTCTRYPLAGFDNKTEKVYMSCAWVSDDSAGTASTTIYADTNKLYGYILYSLETDPAIAPNVPSDNYTVTVSDANGLDMCASNASANRDQTNTEMVACSSSTQPYSVVRGNMTIAVSGAGNSKQGTAILMFLKD